MKGGEDGGRHRDTHREREREGVGQIVREKEKERERERRERDARRTLAQPATHQSYQ